MSVPYLCFVAIFCTLLSPIAMTLTPRPFQATALCSISSCHAHSSPLFRPRLPCSYLAKSRPQPCWLPTCDVIFVILTCKMHVRHCLACIVSTDFQAVVWHFGRRRTASRNCDKHDSDLISHAVHSPPCPNLYEESHRGLLAAQL